MKAYQIQTTDDHHHLALIELPDPLSRQGLATADCFDTRYK
jgi:hypothetical protein